MSLLILLLIHFTNFWIWGIFSESIFLGLLISVTTLLLFFSLEKSKNIFKILFITSLGLLTLLQIKSTQVISLVNISNDDRRLIDMRLREYPPIYVKTFGKTVWIPAANWLEQRPESIAFYRLSKNFSEIIDPNLYFFANHPRERVGIEEIQKYPYLFFPFFVYGLFVTLEKKRKAEWLLSIIAPLIVITIIGSWNKFGPYSFYPFLTVTMAAGITKVLLKIKTFSISRFPLFIAIGTVPLIYFFILLQRFYANS